VEGPTLEGFPVYAGFSRSEVSKWAVAIGIPVSALDRHLYTFLEVSCAGAIAMLLIGVGLAGFQSKKIVAEVRALIAPAMAFGRGETPIIPRLRIREMRDMARQLDSAFRILQDRTRQRDQAEAERKAAEDLSQLKDEFIATVSHELRTPLTSIAVSLELL